LGAVQAAQAPPSSLHSKLVSGSDENEKLAKPEVVEAGGPELIVVSGGFVSTVHL
jgi:hypothetical protein